jgi:hypothetical protein
MPTAQYTALANITLGSSAASVTFSSINGTYRDLMLVVDGLAVTDTGNFRMYVNSDTSSTYASLVAQGNGSSTYTSAGSYVGFIEFFPNALAVNTRGLIKVDFLDYSATDKHKSILIRAGQAASQTTMQTSRWPSTSAITSITIYSYSPGQFGAGSTFALYGVK